MGHIIHSLAKTPHNDLTNLIWASRKPACVSLGQNLEWAPGPMPM